jgi:hypothetical protein
MVENHVLQSKRSFTFMALKGSIEGLFRVLRPKDVTGERLFGEIGILPPFWTMHP